MEEIGAVAMTKDGKRRWTVDQRMMIVNEYGSGVPAGEVCRKYNINAQTLYKWKRQAGSGGRALLRHNGEIVPRQRYLEAMKKIEELERALGRKTLELDILKKSFELKGLKSPDGT